MKVLVTGASGFVGQYLVRHLLDSGDTVVACHSTSEVTGKTPFLVAHPEHQSILNRTEWAPLNVTDKESVASLVKRVKPDAIYHLAGIAFVPEAEENFERALAINVSGTYNIFNACDKYCDRTTVLLISSAEVYGRILPQELPLSEATPLRPANNYSLTKVMAENVAQRFSHSAKVRAVVARPFNHIGAGQNDRFVAPNFARQLAEISKTGCAPILRVGNLESRRDFTDVRDIVRGYRLAALKGNGVYNLGSGRAVAIETLLRKLIEVAELKVSLEYDPTRMRPSEVPEVRADIGKAERELGWVPEIALEDTLREIYRHATRQRSET